MSRAGLWCGIVGAFLFSFGAAAVELPAGPNSDFVSRQCSACHDLDMVVDAAGQTRDGWNGTIDEMISYGLKIAPDERAKMLDYLTGFLGPDSKSKVRGAR